MKPDNPNTVKMFLCQYNYRNETWAIEIPAESFDEARSRIRAISMGRIEGEIVAFIPDQVSWVAKASVRILNFFQHIFRQFA